MNTRSLRCINNSSFITQHTTFSIKILLSIPVLQSCLALQLSGRVRCLLKSAGSQNPFFIFPSFHFFFPHPVIFKAKFVPPHELYPTRNATKAQRWPPPGAGRPPPRPAPSSRAPQPGRRLPGQRPRPTALSREQGRGRRLARGRAGGTGCNGCNGGGEWRPPGRALRGACRGRGEAGGAVPCPAAPRWGPGVGLGRASLCRRTSAEPSRSRTEAPPLHARGLGRPAGRRQLRGAAGLPALSKVS